MAGLVATFVFAAQMINFPVGAGTSGHLMGGALAAVLVGPWTAVLCLSVVLRRPGPADGRRRHHRPRHQHHPDGPGRPCVVGWTVFVVLRRVLPAAARRRCPPAAALGALLSVPVAALVFTLLFAIGGHAPVELSSVVDRDARLAHRDRSRRGGHHRAWWSPASSPRAPTWCTAPARCSPYARSRSAAPSPTRGRRDDHAARFFAAAVLADAARGRGRELLRQRHPDGLEHVAEQTGFSRLGRGLRRLRTARWPTTRPAASTTRASAAASPDVAAWSLVAAARWRAVLGPLRGR